MRTNPVGEHHKACKTMVKSRLRRKRSAARKERLRKSDSSGVCNVSNSAHGIPRPCGTPPSGLRQAEEPMGLSAKDKRPPMVGEDGHQVAIRIFLLGEPFPHLLRQAAQKTRMQLMIVNLRIKDRGQLFDMASTRRVRIKDFKLESQVRCARIM